MRLPTSLTSRLVVTAVALVALVSLALGAVTTLAMRSYLYAQLDDDVAASVRRAGGPVDGGPGGGRPSFPDDPLDTPFVGNQAPGTLLALVDLGDARILDDRRGDDDERLDGAALALLAQVPVDGALHAVDLTGHGTYRVAAVTTQGGTLVTGLPTDDADEIVDSLLLLELLLALSALILAGDRRARRRTPPAAAAARGRRDRPQPSPSCRSTPARSASPSGCRRT